MGKEEYIAAHLVCNGNKISGIQLCGHKTVNGLNKRRSIARAAPQSTAGRNPLLYIYTNSPVYASQHAESFVGRSKCVVLRKPEGITFNDAGVLLVSQGYRKLVKQPDCSKNAPYIVQKANSFSSTIWIETKDRQANPKSLVNLTTLAVSLASKENPSVTLHAEGNDAEKVIKELGDMIANG